MFIDKFKAIKNYSKDDKYVFFDDDIIEGADPATFDLIGVWYSGDKNNIYYLRTPVAGVDRDTFMVMGGNRAKDANHWYCRYYQFDPYQNKCE